MLSTFCCSVPNPAGTEGPQRAIEGWEREKKTKRKECTGWTQPAELLQSSLRLEHEICSLGWKADLFQHGGSQEGYRPSLWRCIHSCHVERSRAAQDWCVSKENWKRNSCKGHSDYVSTIWFSHSLSHMHIPFLLCMMSLTFHSCTVANCFSRLSQQRISKTTSGS